MSKIAERGGDGGEEMGWKGFGRAISEASVVTPRSNLQGWEGGDGGGGAAPADPPVQGPPSTGRRRIACGRRRREGGVRRASSCAR